MSRICQITGKRAMVGNNVSHSNSKTKRKFNPNLQQKRFYIPEEKKWITLKVSTSGLKVINKRGIYACLKEARAKGLIYDKPKAAPTPAKAMVAPTSAKATAAPAKAKATPAKAKVTPVKSK